jgi:hypothetical protein
MTDNKTWHLSKAISISHLVTTFALILGAVMYITSIERDVAILEVNLNNLQKQIIAMESENKQMFEKIDEKLDIMLELIYQNQRVQ